MTSILQFHSLAAARGDGLRPELIALFRSGATVSQTDLTIPDRSRSRTDEGIQPILTPTDHPEKRVVATAVADEGCASAMDSQHNEQCFPEEAIRRRR